MEVDPLEGLRQRYHSKSTEDLMEAATVKRQDYLRQTLEIIDAELAARNVGPEQIDEARKKVKLEDAHRAAGPSGIGGWLLVPLINLIVAIAINVVRNSLTFTQFFSSGGWQVLVSPHSGGYNPFRAAVVVYEIVGNALWVALGGVALYFFLAKLRAAPRRYIVWLVYALAYQVVDFALGLALGLDAFQAVLGIIAYAVFSAVWIPYLRSSLRVQSTFTRETKPRVDH